MENENISQLNEVVSVVQAAKPTAKGTTIVDFGDDLRFIPMPTDSLDGEKSIFQKVGNLKMQEAIPVIPKRVAVACLVLNIIFPGLGTAVSAFASFICPCEEHMAKRGLEVFFLNIMAAIFQLATAVYFLIGYFWGIWWGVMMLQRAPSQTRGVNI